MHNIIEPQTETPKRYQCRHIFTDGHRCGSPCLRGEDLCFYHHTTRRPATHPRARRSRRSTFEIPLPEDQSAIQHSIGQVLQRIAANDIDPRRAGLLLYGLQIASLNLPKQQPATKSEPQTIEEITIDPTLGVLAPRAEVSSITERKSPVTRLLESMLQRAEETIPPEPATIPTLQAAEDSAAQPITSAVEGLASRGCPRVRERFVVSNALLVLLNAAPKTINAAPKTRHAAQKPSFRPKAAHLPP